MEALFLVFVFIVGVMVGYILVPVLDPVFFKNDDGGTLK